MDDQLADAIIEDSGRAACGCNSHVDDVCPDCGQCFSCCEMVCQVETPEALWLQVLNHPEITWCVDNINPSDVHYTKSDTLPLTPDTYQHEAAKTARQDASELGHYHKVRVINRLKAALHQGRHCERIKKELFHGQILDETLPYPQFSSDQLPENSLLINWILGAFGELAELVEAILRDDSSEQIVSEYADVGWYWAMIGNALGISMGDAMAANLAKLQERHGDEFTEHLSGESA